MAHVAWSLAIDLQNNKISAEEPYHNPSLACTTPAMAPLIKFPYHTSQPASTALRVNEDRRALLACYIVTASAATMLRYDQVRWSPSLEEAVQGLSKDRELAGDEILTALAKIARVTDKATRTFRRNMSKEPSPSERTTSSSSSSAEMVLMQVATMQASLTQVKSELSESTLANSKQLYRPRHRQRQAASANA
jgi:hypothetical protein